MERLALEKKPGEHSAKAPSRQGSLPATQRGFDLEKFFEFSIDLCCVVDSQGFFVKMNPAWSEVLGYSKEELLAKPFLSFVHPDDYEMTAGIHEQVQEGDRVRNFVNRYLTKEGKVVFLRWSAFFEKSYWYCNATDITEIEELNRIFSDCCAAAKIGAWRFSPSSKKLFWTDETYAIHGLKKEKPIDVDSVIGLYREESRCALERAFRAATVKGEGFDLELQLLSPSGDRWMRWTGRVDSRDSQNPALYGTIQDIHEHKFASLRRQNLEGRLKALAKNFPGMLYQFQIDQQGQPSFTYVSEGCRQLYGISPEAIVEDVNQLINLIDPSERGPLFASIDRSARSLSPFAWECEHRLTTGEVKLIQVKSLPEKSFDGRVIWSGVAVDITESRKNEERLKEAEKKIMEASRLSSMGEMASGIAHEINNPLAIISGASENLVRRLKAFSVEDEKLFEFAEKIRATTHRIAKIIRGLRQFAREGSGDRFSTVCFQSCLEETLSFCQHRLTKNNVQFILDIEDDIRFEGRSIQVSQVLVNLLTNAADAVEGIDSAWIKVSAHKHPRFVRITVENSGPPIPQPIQARIMEAFFTTKAPGKGTGLGLSLSQALVEDHQGRLYLDSSANHPRFVVELPYSIH